MASPSTHTLCVRLVVAPRAATLLRLLAGAPQRLDGEWLHAGPLANLAILLLEESAGRSVAFEPAKNFSGDAAVRALAAVLVGHVEEHVFRAASRFPSHCCCPLFAAPPARAGCASEFADLQCFRLTLAGCR